MENNNMMTLQERLETGARLHAEGYNCAQSVIMAFEDVTGVDSDLASAVAASFGAGFGGNGQLCGAVAGMGMVYGLGSRPKPSAKKLVYLTTRSLSDEFVAKNGSLVCKELKGEGRVPCHQLIADAITIVHNRLTNKE